MNFDFFTKNDQRFPLPEENVILVADGFGLFGKETEKLFPSSLLQGILQSLPSPEAVEDRFFPFPRTQKYKLPEESLYVRYSPYNRRWQEILRRGEDTPLFSVLYDRDYERVTIEAVELIFNVFPEVYNHEERKSNIDNPQWVQDYQQRCRQAITAYLFP
jgi:hypothetical protein